jgi:hypothetical protein
MLAKPYSDPNYGNRNTACHLPLGEGETYPDSPEELRQLELELRERLDVPASQEFVTDYP